MSKAYWTILSAACLVLTGCSDQPQDTALTQETVKDVQSTSVVVRDGTAREFSGTVAAVRKIAVAARLGAYVTVVRHREGDMVKKGDVLIELDQSDVASALTQAQSDVDAARLRLKDAAIDLERFESLYREEAASEIEVRKVRLVRDQNEQALKAAQARLKQAKARLTDSTIRAPEDSRVVSVTVEPGMLAVPGVPLLRLESLQGLVFEVHVPVSLLQEVKPGQKAVVKLDTRKDAIQAVVERVVFSADSLTRTGLVKLALPTDCGCLPGMFGRASIAGAAQETGVWVDEKHLAQRGGLTGVFVIRDDRALFQWLRLGRTDENGQVQVIAGLTGDETIVAQPQALLFDGDRIRVKAEEKPLPTNR
ncbi:MAG: efflux RND transporter periplasmic adaptor subunit [Sutterellaceae bacterium]|nr:efflux RND transporter periplasmic adaptor subunit [Sutterellaceae bacterium]